MDVADKTEAACLEPHRLRRSITLTIRSSLLVMDLALSKVHHDCRPDVVENINRDGDGVARENSLLALHVRVVPPRDVAELVQLRYARSLFLCKSSARRWS